MTQDAKIARLAEYWSNRYSDLAPRIQRAVGLVPGVRPSLVPGSYLVTGSQGDTYIVHVRGKTSTCSCKDSFMGHHCKHRLAAALYHSSLQGGPNMTLTETMTCPVCHKLAPIQKTDPNNGIAPHLAPCGALCMFGQFNWINKADRIINPHVHGKQGKCPRCGVVKSI